MNIERLGDSVLSLVNFEGDIFKLYLDYVGIDVNALSDNELEGVRYALNVALHDIIEEVKS